MKKLDIYKLTTDDFTKQPDPNCESWKAYKKTKSKDKKKELVLRNKFWLWQNLNAEHWKPFTKILRAHSNKCVLCEEELNKHMSDEQDTRMCENCSSNHDYCKVCDEHSYDDNGVNCDHKVWNPTIGSYSGTGDSETDAKYYRRSLWELCETMGGNFASDLLIAATAITHGENYLFNFEYYSDCEIVVGKNIYKISDTDAVQCGFDWIWTLPVRTGRDLSQRDSDKAFETRCQEIFAKTIKWLIEYISLANNSCYTANGYAQPYNNKYVDFNLIGEDTNYPYYMELLASINTILGKKEEDYYCPCLDDPLRDILKSSCKKIVYTITRKSMFEWELLITKPNGDFITRKIERNKIRCQAQLIHFLKGRINK